MAYAAPGGFVPPIEDGMSDSFRRAAENAVAATLDALADDAKGVRLEHEIIHGGATEVLVEAAKSAELLVVGSRGHGSFAGLLLGSVSQQCVQHAPCPVVIVRHQATGPG
jgi:nucleotide-binding universal stress UspA family protein